MKTIWYDNLPREPITNWTLALAQTAILEELDPNALARMQVMEQYALMYLQATNP